MKYFLSATALVLGASVASGQQPAPVATTVVGPECGTPTPVTIRGDSVCISRSAAIASALAANPQLQVAGAVAQQARAARVQGVALPDPVASAEWGGSRAPFGYGAGGADSRTYGALITIPFIDKFRLNGRIGTAGIRQSEADSIAVQQAVASATSQAYDQLLSALRRHANLQLADSLAADFLRKTQARFDAGTVARLDVVNAQVVVAQTQNDFIDNEREIANARAGLNRLLGRPLGAPLSTADTLAVPGDLPGLNDLEAAALQRRPELLSLEQQQRGAHAATSLAREYWLPDLTIGLSRDYLADPTPGYLTTGLSFPIPILFRNHARGEIAQGRYREEELAASYRDLRAAVSQDVRVAYATAISALRQARFIRDALLPATQQAYRIAAASYALGGLSALEVNAARAALVDAESQYTDALAAANSARAELERAVSAPLATFATGVSQ
ncbi:MAG: TolC family protein [Gemmatimonadota bacterium]